MTNEEKVTVAVATVLVVLATKSYLKTRRQERRKRAEIMYEALMQINAIRVAEARVQHKIWHGKDNYRSMDDIINDLKFEMIAVREGE